MKLFVPGRICLFGEHTDWAAGYRTVNPSIEKGFCLITGTDQGIYADVEPCKDALIFEATLDTGEKQGPWKVSMDPDSLETAAQRGGFFSYVAGVALEISRRYHTEGLRINNYRTDLPVKKGLSSSAAVCVLVARAFNRIYNLSLSTADEMDLAYRGELHTGSQCGRMDQGCAYGSRPILMECDKEDIGVRELSVGADFHFIIVDLQAEKDTRTILRDLNRCYPQPANAIEKNVHDFLGVRSADLTHLAVAALKNGDSETLGQLMTTAQKEFDALVAPASPHELTAPVLHRLLNYEPIQPLILGGKGVGSQGDGTAQLLVRNPETRTRVIKIIETELNMHCLELTIPRRHKVRKAVIPAAGFGTRLFPMTKSLKKEFFPVIDSRGQIKPVIQAIVEEAVDSGIEEICLVVQERDIPVFKAFFHESPAPDLEAKLSDDAQKSNENILKLGKNIHFAAQKSQDGFGHAVHCAADFVGDEPFLLMLGDHLFTSKNGVPCARQAMDVFEKTGTSVVGLQKTPGDQVHHFGSAAGAWSYDRNSDVPQYLEISEFSEKPTLDYARKNLLVEGLEADTFLTLFGMYVLKPDIFVFLDRNITNNQRENGEFQLTSCLDELRETDGFTGILIQGKRFDMGHPEAYFDTFVNYKGEQ